MGRNVLLLTIDSLRADHLSQFDHNEHCMPNLEALGEEGVSFEKAFATGPGTSPSFPAILTGTYPLDYDGLGPLSDERPRLSEDLRSAGLSTGAFQSNLFLSGRFNYYKGFDEFKDYQNLMTGLATRIFPRGIEINNPVLEPLDEVLHVTDILKKSYQLLRGKPRPYVEASKITDDTLAWLSDVEGSFFCWTHYMDVHPPCYPPREYRAEFGVAGVSQSTLSDLYSKSISNPDEITSDEHEVMHASYEAAMSYVDDQIGRIVDYLKERDEYEDTVVLVTSDHGELFGEWGAYAKPERMYDELIHVPLIVVNGSDVLSEATEELVSLIDIPPIVMDSITEPIPSDYEGRMPGRDEPRSHILAEHQVGDEVVVGARSDDWLYEADEIRGEHRLYDLRDGMQELVELGGHSGAETVRQAVYERLNELDVTEYRIGDEVEESARSRLEELGYL